MPDTLQRRRELLEKVGLFEGLEPEDYDVLLPLLQYKTFVRDQVIVEVGEDGEALFLVEHGRLKVVLHDNQEREVILAFLKEGEYFGEMALLDQKPRSASVVALSTTHLFSLPRDAFLSYVDEHPRTLLHLLRKQFERLRLADEIRRDLVLLDVYGRVARLLLQLAQDEGEWTEEGTLLRNPPSQQQIASMIGSSRETVSRTVNELMKTGTLVKVGRKLLITSEWNLYNQIEN
jgi:CRP-like cAMP-binding protein